MKLPSGVKDSGPFIISLIPASFQQGHPDQGLLHVLGEVLRVGVEQREVEALGDAVDGPGDGVLLVTAHDQAADLFLEIDQPVGVAQCRQFPRHALDSLGDQILMLHRHQRHVHPGQGADLARPLAGAVHHHLASNLALFRDHRRNPPVLAM